MVSNVIKYQLRFVVAALGAALLLTPLFALAEGSELVSITPVVVDEKAKARDILKQSITLKNISNRTINLYPAVNNINPKEGEEDFQTAYDSTDRAASLANWIELSRGVIEMKAGEEKTIPYIVRVNHNAAPDTYHAVVSFSEGSTRAQAEEKEAVASVMINVEVQADIKEIMQLNKFFTENLYFSGDDVLFNYQLENIGNQELRPRGEIRIYDRKGEEVASVDVNKDGRAFSPSQAAQLASVWSAANGFGKYKAFLNVEYGNGQAAAVQDTIFFWIIPWKQLLGLFIASLVAIIVFALYFHKWFERRHLEKFAAQGMLVDPEVHQERLKNMQEKAEQFKAPAAASAPAAPPKEKKSRFGFLKFGRGKAKKTQAAASQASASQEQVVPQAPSQEPPQAQQPPAAPSQAPQSVGQNMSQQTPTPQHEKQSLRDAWNAPAEPRAIQNDMQVPPQQPATAAPPGPQPTGDKLDLRALRQQGTPGQPQQPPQDAGGGHVINLKRK